MLYPSDGWLRNSLENRLNNINRLEVYHEIRGNAEFITALFYEVDEQLRALPKHPEAHLWPSEVVTLGLLQALKGVGNRPFYRWLTVRRESAL